MSHLDDTSPDLPTRKRRRYRGRIRSTAVGFAPGWPLPAREVSRYPAGVSFCPGWPSPGEVTRRPADDEGVESFLGWPLVKRVQ